MPILHHVQKEYEAFKKECKLIVIVSKETGIKKEVIKYKDKIYMTADKLYLFNAIKSNKK